MADTLKIALLTHSINPRGGVVHVLELGRALQERGHEVTLVAPAAPGQGFFRETPCRVELAEAPLPGVDLAETVQRRIDAMRSHMATLLERERFDVLHAHDGIGANALADLAEQDSIAGYVRTVHHVDRYGDERVQAWEERSIRAASQVLCVSALWRERLRGAYGIEAAQVDNGIDLERYTPNHCASDEVVAQRHGIGANRPLVLTVGGIEARKNTRRLLQAVLQLRARLPQTQLVVAGGASLLDHRAEGEAFRAEAAAAGVPIGRGEPVVLTGPLADSEMPALYRRADVLAMPSLLEGFGLAALEALACGTPAVVSRVAPFTEHFSHDDVAWADPLDPGSIADALQRAVARGRHRDAPVVCRRFSWAASAAHHEALYRLPQFAWTTEEIRMPAMHYRLRWPDGSESTCYSPSLVIKDYLEPGAQYPLPDFLQRVHEASHIASERVLAKFGFLCSRAGDELAGIEQQAARFAEQPGAIVQVVEFQE